jgi:hypothetical protein
MSALAIQRPPEPGLPEPGLDDAVVEAAEIVAGHDGAAELLVRLRHGNGALSSVTLDPETGFDLLRAAGASSLDSLVGEPWRQITRGLWNL